MISFDCLGWIAAFVLQVVLLGKNLYTLIQLEDLKLDRINPWVSTSGAKHQAMHSDPPRSQDCADRVNRFLKLENIAQALLATELLISRKWFSAIVHSGAAMYLAYLFFGRKLNMTVRELSVCNLFDRLRYMQQTTCRRPTHISRWTI